MNEIFKQLDKYASLIKGGSNIFDEIVSKILGKPTPLAINQRAPTPVSPSSKPQASHEHAHGTEALGKIGPYRITSLYGERIHPVTGKRKFHDGIDIAVPEGTPILSFGDGVVSRVGYDQSSGKFIAIDHGDFESIYCHMSDISMRQGQKVKAEQVVGMSGNTGMSTGPHLHFRLKKNNTSIDPLPYLQSRRIV